MILLDLDDILYWSQEDRTGLDVQLASWCGRRRIVTLGTQSSSCADVDDLHELLFCHSYLPCEAKGVFKSSLSPARVVQTASLAPYRGILTPLGFLVRTRHVSDAERLIEQYHHLAPF